MRGSAVLAAGLLAGFAVAPAAAPIGAPGDRSGGGAGPRPAATALAVVRYVRPVPGAVVRPFEPPPTPYAAGHRGVDLAAVDGERVRAAADGVVRFAGSVAGRGVLVLVHPDGISTEYEPVRPLVRPGTPVRGRQVVGVIAGRHASCPDRCLHWGAKRGGQYLDPLGLLRPLGPVALLPWPRDG